MGILLIFALWVLFRYLTGQDITFKGLAFACWGWLSLPGTALFLAFITCLNLINFQLKGTFTFIVYVLLIIVFIRKVERPFNTLTKPTWYLGTLSLWFLCAIFLTSIKHAKYVDDGKDDIRLKFETF